MQREKFRQYLLTNHRGKLSGKPLTRKTAGDCVARICRVERLLNLDLDAGSLSPSNVEVLTKQLRATLSGRSFGDLASTLRRYAEFRGQLTR